jgi:hypothetical protein
MQELKQIQKKNRKAIIMACNPKARTYEEALEMELGIGCIASVNSNDPQPIIAQGFDYDKQEKVFGFTYAKDIDSTCDDSIFFFPNCSDLKIIGKPLTLTRVLIALSEKCYGIDQAELTDNILIYTRPYDESAEWNLTKKTLEEQSEKTQREINKLLNEV